MYADPIYYSHIQDGVLLTNSRHFSLSLQYISIQIPSDKSQGAVSLADNASDMSVPLEVLRQFHS